MSKENDKNALSADALSLPADALPFETIRIKEEDLLLPKEIAEAGAYLNWELIIGDKKEGNHCNLTHVLFNYDKNNAFLKKYNINQKLSFNRMSIFKNDSDNQLFYDCDNDQDNISVNEGGQTIARRINKKCDDCIIKSYKRLSLPYFYANDNGIRYFKDIMCIKNIAHNYNADYAGYVDIAGFGGMDKFVDSIKQAVIYPVVKNWNVRIIEAYNSPAMSGIKITQESLYGEKKLSAKADNKTISRTGNTPKRRFSF